MTASIGRIADLVGGWRARDLAVMLWCVAVAGAALLLATRLALPGALLALLFGFGSGSIARFADLAKLKNAGSALLRVGIALLGTQISLPELAAMGTSLDLVAIASLVASLASGLVLGRLLGLSRSQSVMGSGAVAICGASAALALSGVLPRGPNHERDTAFTVAAATILSTAAMIGYPVIAGLLNLSSRQAGAFFGSSIHDIAQVVGAGASVSAEALEVATVSKLVRVACLVPIVALVGAAFGNSGRRKSSARPPFVPPFLIAFILLALANSMGLVPAAIATACSSVFALLMVLAITILGITTRIGDLWNCGWRPVALMLVQTILIAVVALCLAKLLVA